MSGTGRRATVRHSLFLLTALPAAAHMVSISTGEIRIEGSRARYEMRMPLYEIAHMQNPEPALLEAVKFTGARRVDGKCRVVEAESALICVSNYEFAKPAEALEAASSLHSITVPNHVHLLRAVKGEHTDQAVLDLSFPRNQLRFRPPTLLEQAVQQGIAGSLRAAGGAAQWLFLVALVLAARSRRELLLLALTFMAGEVVSCLLTWQPAPRFVEAACALIIAYLALEILLLPQAGQRWLVAGVLGVFHGLYFSLFISSSEYKAGWVLLGVLLIEGVLIAAIGWALSKIRIPLRPVSAVLTVVGLGWFFLRLRS